MPFLKLLKPQPEVKPEVKPEIISEPEPQIIKPPENEVHEVNEVNIEYVHEPEIVNAPEEISGDSGAVLDSESDSSDNIIQEEQQVQTESESIPEQVQEQEQGEESESESKQESESEIENETQEITQDSQSSDNQQEQDTDSEPESKSKPESESGDTITSEPQGQDITQDQDSESTQDLGNEEPITSEPPTETLTLSPDPEPTEPQPFELQYDFTSGQRYVDLVSTKTEFDKMLDELANISKELLEHEAERFAKKYAGKFKAEDGKTESEADALKYEAFLGGYISNAAMLLYDKGYRDIAIKQLDQAKLKLEATKRLEEETAAIHARVEENNDAVDLSDILGMFGDG